MKWDGTVGPASIISFLGALAVLVTMGVAWGTFTMKIDATAVRADEARAAIAEVNKNSVQRDKHVADLSEKIAKIDTSVSFLVPALQRIEQKLDAKP